MRRTTSTIIERDVHRVIKSRLWMSKGQLYFMLLTRNIFSSQEHPDLGTNVSGWDYYAGPVSSVGGLCTVRR